MRLIDADALSDRMFEEAMIKDSGMQRWDSGCWIRYSMFELVLDQQPTAYVGPIRSGKWIVHVSPDRYHADNVSCSVCGTDVEAYSDEYKYCPYCGARMDK